MRARIVMAALETRYLEAGDPAAAEQRARYGLRLGEQLTAGEGSHTLIGQLVGTAVERVVLKPLEPDRVYEFLPDVGAYSPRPALWLVGWPI
ncbi:MAG: hypothetical protein M5U12_18420 [Verrucomicrobia bacterium]|nr:hypothetical protein [Verrucomicrobiota bacterium]